MQVEHSPGKAAIVEAAVVTGSEAKHEAIGRNHLGQRREMELAGLYHDVWEGQFLGTTCLKPPQAKDL